MHKSCRHFFRHFFINFQKITWKFLLEFEPMDYFNTNQSLQAPPLITLSIYREENEVNFWKIYHGCCNLFASQAHCVTFAIQLFVCATLVPFFFQMGSFNNSVDQISHNFYQIDCGFWFWIFSLSFVHVTKHGLSTDHLPFLSI